jgi:hypothetical protein
VSSISSSNDVTLGDEVVEDLLDRPLSDPYETREFARADRGIAGDRQQHCPVVREEEPTRTRFILHLK